LAAALKNKYAINAKLIKSGGGAFEITKDNILIFSKKQTGRFPDHKEIFTNIDKG
jgi:selT/selW/selH-like putative selenoprotein